MSFHLALLKEPEFFVTVYANELNYNIKYHWSTPLYQSSNIYLPVWNCGGFKYRRKLWIQEYFRFDGIHAVPKYIAITLMVVHMILEIAEFAMNKSMRFSKFLNNMRLQKFHLDNSTSEDVFYDIWINVAHGKFVKKK